MGKDIFEIDKYALDDEWESQPLLYKQIATRAAIARKKLEKLKAHLKVTKAEIDKDIRSHPDKYGISKITEPVIENTIEMDKKYKELHEQCLECKFTVEVLDAKVTAMDHRKSALENIVKLFLASYFSKPTKMKKA